MTDTDLINKITTAAMQDLSRDGATATLADFHLHVCETAHAIFESYPRTMIVAACVNAILSAWALALNSSESPNDILKAIERRVNGG